MTAMAAPKKPTNKGGRPKNADPKASLASLKGSEQYRAWLEGLAEHAHLPLAILIEHALREYAENHGYEPVQPRR